MKPILTYLTQGLKRACIAGSLFIVACSSTSEKNLIDWVDTYIGTGGHGHVFMGASVPFGMVQLGPTSIPQTWDWTSGYHISDTTVIGFSHTHLNGTGIGDLSDVSLMPVTGENVTFARGVAEDTNSGIWSTFTRVNERTSPGYYATRLDRYGVDVELTATARVGFHKYTFGEGKDPRVVIDMENGTCWDEPVETHITKVGDKTIEGYRFSKGWANAQRTYFSAEFSEPITSFELYSKDSADATAQIAPGTQLTASRIYGQARFNIENNKPLYVKVALSPVSIENARKNMSAELSGWDFPQTVAAAHNEWNKELSRVKIETADESVKKIFYTALYHTMVAPSLFCDVNGDYRGADGEMHNDSTMVNYSTFSLWDTYRAAMPLATIIHPDRMPDFINTMITICEQQGKLPVWHLQGCETDCMVGNPGIPVVADAVLKDYAGVDAQRAYRAMKQSAMLDERGLDLYKQYGYIPSDKYNEAVATALEYALADWSVAQVAQKLGYDDDYKYFTDRSNAYKHYFDPSTGFLRGRNSDGKFRTPFNPVASTHREDDYTEGNAWQYTWLVPHNINGLIESFGSKDAFVQKLDSLFLMDSNLGEGASPDISGLVGQYAHGNEPSHHILYIYTMIGQPEKTADKVREVLSTLYHAAPDGLSGNEDVGQMSAWYVLSSLGFYQIEPSGGRYYFGSPIVDKATLKVRDGEFRITASNNSSANKYIQKITLNGKPYTKSYIDHSDIARGGDLVIEMGAQPAMWY